MHVFPKPEPEPVVPAAAVAAPLSSVVVPVPATDAQEPGSDPSGADRARAEAAAEALLAQLAVESRHDRLNVPEFLNSKGRIGVFVAVAMTVLCALGIGTLAVIGSIFG
jgi:hypothetical protein